MPSKEALDPQEIPVKIAGRMMLKRAMGKASFATVQDVSGQIQLYINNQGVGEAAHENDRRLQTESSHGRL